MTTTTRSRGRVPEGQTATVRANPAERLRPRRITGDGFSSARQNPAAARSKPPRARNLDESLALITGGGGFIGVHLSAALLRRGWRVRILDDLSCAESQGRLQWLRSAFPVGVTVVQGDVRDEERVGRAVAGASHVFHCASNRPSEIGAFGAEAYPPRDGEYPLRDIDGLPEPLGGAPHATVAPERRGDGSIQGGCSIPDDAPRFAEQCNEVIIGGTRNVLNACLQQERRPQLLLSSTTALYGDMADLRLCAHEERFEPIDDALRISGFDDSLPLAPRDPHAAATAVADRLVRQVAAEEDLHAVVLRVGEVYGPFQSGRYPGERVAHALRCALTNEPMRVPGDGRAVRDLLYVDDLIQAMLAAIRGIERVRGCAMNVGGGASNAFSTREIISIVEALHGAAPRLRPAEQRAPQPRFFVANSLSFQTATGWRPKISVGKGMGKLYDWLSAQLVPDVAGCDSVSGDSRALAAGG